MSECITNFFDAWQIEEDELRLAKITSATIENIRYDDPRTPETLDGIAALNNYVGMFSANAPGWSAKVVVSIIFRSLFGGSFVVRRFLAPSTAS
ncbi:MAG: hypothetical protein ABW104_19680 [Candidatus Thiodiazotropha sp. 6PLUC2]